MNFPEKWVSWVLLLCLEAISVFDLYRNMPWPLPQKGTSLHLQSGYIIPSTQKVRIPSSGGKK